MKVLIKDVDLVIMSADKSNRNDFQNQCVSDSMARDLQLSGFRFSRVEGFFNGRKENSFIVLCDDRLSDLLETANAYNQDFVLLLGAFLSVDGSRPALLSDCSGMPKKSGKWVEIQKHEKAKCIDGYTELSDGSVYTVKWED